MSTDSSEGKTRVSNPLAMRLAARSRGAHYDCEVSESSALVAPDSLENAARPKFTLAFKLQVVSEIEALPRGERGSYLRRMGLYSSTVDGWRKAHKGGYLAPEGEPQGPSRRQQIAELRKQLDQANKRAADAEKRARQAELVLEAQKKIFSILGDGIPN